FATVKVYPDEHIPNLKGFLKGQIGNGTLTFKVQDCFTRMLAGNEAADESDFQAGHSNFNYSRIGTDTVEMENARSYFFVPQLDGLEKHFLGYPDFDPGQYELDAGAAPIPLKHTDSVVVPVRDDASQLMTFRKEDGSLPSRIIVAVMAQRKNARGLPAECS